MADKYNGWTNYETWCINLWLTNDENSVDYWTAEAADIYGKAKAKKPFTRKEQAVYYMAESLKEQIEGIVPELTGMFADLLNAALSEVDWREIAEHWIDDATKDVAKAECHLWN